MPAKSPRPTAEAAQEQFAALEGDRRINHCFWFLVRLVTATRSDGFTGELARLGLTNPTFTSGLAFVQQSSLSYLSGWPREARPWCSSDLVHDEPPKSFDP